MKLYLLRHGDAVSDSQDNKRSLSTQGQIEVEKIAQFLLNSDVDISEILHSSKLRAKQSAEIIHRIVCPSANITESKGLLPNDDPKELADTLNSFTQNTLLATHLPFIGDLCSYLTTNDLNVLDVKFTTATIACLEKQYTGWQIAWIVNPGMVGA